MKHLLILTELHNFKKASTFDGFIIPINGFSKGFEKPFDVQTIQDCFILASQYTKEIYLYCNDLYKDEEIKELVNLVTKLNCKALTGVIISDIGLIEAFKKTKLNYKLVYYPSHLLTTYQEVNTFKKDKIKGVFLASNIPNYELYTVIKKSKLPTYLVGYAHLQLFTSITNLVSNFAQEYNLQISNKTQLTLEEQKRPGNFMPIIECSRGTTIFDSKPFIISDIDSLNKVGLSYLVYDARFQDLEILIKKCKEKKNYAR